MRAMRVVLMNMTTIGVILLAARDAAAYRMIQNSGVGRTSTGSRVLCSDPGGFVHWNSTQVSFRLNPASQGGESGTASALQRALASWTNVSPAGYQLNYAGTTNAGFTTDGVNTLLFATGNGCSGSCLAITALVLTSGQVIQETDVSFNNAYDWNTNGANYDVEAIAAHEIGHCMGIHHTEITKPKNRPTMYTAYFGLDGRTLEADDRDALNCAYNRYPVASRFAELADEGVGDPERGVELLSRVRDGRATLRYAMYKAGMVQLDVFDVAGRRITTLVSGERGAGEHEIAWGGETATGTVSRGVYFARLETPQGRDVTTILLGR